MKDTMLETDVRPCCLTVAGSDSGGNAGVQADLRTFHAYGLHGCTVFAALTAQNPSAVTAIHGVPPAFVAAQLDAVLGVYSIRAMKTGMLADPAAISVLADRLAGHPEIAKVVDPVMIATSGARLVPEETTRAIVERLLPLATLLTPNLPEAECLCASAGRPASPTDRAGTADRARALAGELNSRYGCAVLVKGGHGAGSSAVDVLCTGHGEFTEFSLPWVEDPVSTHGTGCSLAAALAAELALGRSVADAVAGAKAYVRDAIAGAFRVGPCCGVLGFAPRCTEAVR